MRLLLLGGTGEARSLAAALVESGIDVTSSLAGRVSNPALPVGAVRIGGFGGVAGLIAYLQAEAIDAVVDATHPFAATITAHAADACHATEVPLLVLQRPAWPTEPGWTLVPDTAAAAAAARGSSPARSCSPPASATSWPSPQIRIIATSRAPSTRLSRPRRT